ncbi:uncharacterized protein PV07_12717 [Cladophialophora immunda]|uniref:Uncharacterized protein n=1 Tax=Cladophialophora immunda TaxID=569365 RepID=A0A0D2BTW3_9EURO|nr:uncharacterized protein PV07_12717 [Cladophialophora immunda]KIW21865.1 hypothetical protein PV07_12717 [Cladophialophora immunda]
MEDSSNLDFDPEEYRQLEEEGWFYSESPQPDSVSTTTPSTLQDLPTCPTNQLPSSYHKPDHRPKANTATYRRQQPMGGNRHITMTELFWQQLWKRLQGELSAMIQKEQMVTWKRLRELEIALPQIITKVAAFSELPTGTSNTSVNTLAKKAIISVIDKAVALPRDENYHRVLVSDFQLPSDQLLKELTTHQATLSITSSSPTTDTLNLLHKEMIPGGSTQSFIDVLSVKLPELQEELHRRNEEERRNREEEQLRHREKERLHREALERQRVEEETRRQQWEKEVTGAIDSLSPGKVETLLGQQEFASDAPLLRRLLDRADTLASKHQREESAQRDAGLRKTFFTPRAQQSVVALRSALRTVSGTR